MHPHSTLRLAACLALAAFGAASQASPVCNETNTPFQQAYAQQYATGTDMLTMDLVNHSYRFQPTVNMTVCSIGYQSPSPGPTGYRMRLIDVTVPGSPLLLFNQLVPSSYFQANPPLTPSYLPTGDIPLTAGHTYEMRRTAIGYGGAYALLIGRALTGQTGNFPVYAPNLTLLSSKFWGAGGPLTDTVLPFIDFGTH